MACPAVLVEVGLHLQPGGGAEADHGRIPDQRRPGHLSRLGRVHQLTAHEDDSVHDQELAGPRLCHRPRGPGLHLFPDGRPRSAPESADGGTSPLGREPGRSRRGAKPTKNVTLFFLREADGLLVAEEREIAASDFARSRRPRRVWPSSSRARRGDSWRRLRPRRSSAGSSSPSDGTAYVDFSPRISSTIIRPARRPRCPRSMPSSIRLAYNFKSIKKVFLLIDGEERETLAGHIGLDRPFLPDYSLHRQTLNAPGRHRRVSERREIHPVQPAGAPEEVARPFPAGHDPGPGLGAVRPRGKRFELVDTGGFFDSGASRSPQVKKIGLGSGQAADVLIVLLLDGKNRASCPPNRISTAPSKSSASLSSWPSTRSIPRPRKADSAIIYRLGEERLFFVSAEHKIGLVRPGRSDRRRRSREEARTSPAADAQPLRIAIIGRINVGKSSLANRLCGEERFIVSEMPGTTRDSSDILIRSGPRILSPGRHGRHPEAQPRLGRAGERRRHQGEERTSPWPTSSAWSSTPANSRPARTRPWPSWPSIRGSRSSSP